MAANEKNKKIVFFGCFLKIFLREKFLDNHLRTFTVDWRPFKYYECWKFEFFSILFSIENNIFPNNVIFVYMPNGGKDGLMDHHGAKDSETKCTKMNRLEMCSQVL
jgi:hypothetical protein